jgi:hypothetical protein
MRWIATTLAAAGIALAGCGRPVEDLPPASGLMRTFACDSLVQRMGVPELHPAGGWFRLTESSAAGRLRRCEHEYTLHDGEAFDEQRFIQRLRTEVENAAVSAGMHPAHTRHTGGRSRFDYTAGPTRGWMEWGGERISGNRFRVWAELREPAPHRDS